ncbi:MAG: GMC oxidoreductase [Desulfovibrionales bacterium]
MLIDTRYVDDKECLRTDVCIAGAGLAGTVLAREFAGSDFKVALLESGGLQPDKASQSLYAGENSGMPYYSADTCRTRFFGGTSHRWTIPICGGRQGVRLREMDGIDFEERDWIPNSGWPFPKTHLEGYLDRAEKVCGIDESSTRVPGERKLSDAFDGLPLDQDRVRTTLFRFGDRELFFRTYGREVCNAVNINIFLYANVTKVLSNETGSQVTGLKIVTLDGKAVLIQANIYVLALGGIETPRLLLLSDSVQKMGLGNANDLVGRFFMEHPHLWSGYFVPAGPSVKKCMRPYAMHCRGKVPAMGKRTLSDDVLREERLLNWCTSLNPAVRPLNLLHPSRESKGTDSLRHMLQQISRGRIPEDIGTNLGNMALDLKGILNNLSAKGARVLERELGRNKRLEIFRLNHMAEQVPNPDSRISLSNDRDILGQRRIRICWRLTQQDIRSIHRSQEILDQELTRAGLGKLIIEMDPCIIPDSIHGGWHHMGTTRMHINPKMGVVDPECRIHGFSNIYIAGASVFPTGGYANPVLTTLALVLRLADRIKKQMSQEGGISLREEKQKTVEAEV